MKIACGYRILEDDLFAWIDKARDEGFSHLEIPTTNLPSDPDDADRVVAYAKKMGFSLSLHAPFGKTNITSPDPEVREG
jgi:sugar phosphate isomerase/epimerase